jgi:hypothetical protein
MAATKGGHDEYGVVRKLRGSTPPRESLDPLNRR